MAWLFWKDKRPAWVQAEEREFIKAVNSLQTLQCSGLMKPDTHLGENARQIEVSDDQTRRSFSAEFKREAADLVLKQNYSYIEASRSLGVGESALRRWVDQVQQERQGVTPQSKALTPEQQKTQELEARIARLEREKSILKKATALLMSEDHERTR